MCFVHAVTQRRSPCDLASLCFIVNLVSGQVVLPPLLREHRQECCVASGSSRRSALQPPSFESGSVVLRTGRHVGQSLAVLQEEEVSQGVRVCDLHPKEV